MKNLDVLSDSQLPTPTSRDNQGLTTELKHEAGRLGFAPLGVCLAVAPAGIDQFRQWLAAGYAGQMHYLSARAEAYADPGTVLDGARSILMLALPYRTVEPGAPQSTAGRVSRYAWGADYHDLIRQRLNELADWLVAKVPEAKVRGVVDTAPLLEREFAQAAGLGWIGKNTLLLNKQAGSWFFLAALLTDLELACDTPHQTDHCGTCRACLDACPTGAFVDAYVLDARRCISYLTIELKDPIPVELRPGVGDWAFGCDICQEVCPWNHKAPRSSEPALAPRGGQTALDLIELLGWSDAQFRDHFRHTPLWRPKRRGILRNAAIVLGNRRPAEGLVALATGLHDGESLVRGAAAWALGQYRCQAARLALVERQALESDPQVCEEIAAALNA
jgi:epoxyqueuosine reductase